MGAYENPQVFAPDYNVIGQNFQQGFNTMYQVMQQRKAKKEAQKKKRDEAEAAFYSGTSLPKVYGLDKKWQTVINDYYRQSLGGFEGFDSMNKRGQAEILADIGYMEGGMKGLSEAILKYQSGKHSSSLDPKVMGLLDRIVYPKKDDSGEWGYDVRIGDNGVEFFYTEDGDEKSVSITDMSTWGQLVQDPTEHVNNIRDNIAAEWNSPAWKNAIISGKISSGKAMEQWLSEGGIQNILDLDANDIGTVNYYNQYVNKGGDYHPSKEMMEKELEAIKKEGIPGINDDDVITDEELQAYHKYQDKEIRDHITGLVRSGFETHEASIPEQTGPVVYNTEEDAQTFIANQKKTNEENNPGIEYHGITEPVMNRNTQEIIGYKVKWTQRAKATGNEYNVDTDNDGVLDAYKKPLTFDQQLKLNDRVTEANLRSNLKVSMSEELNWFRNLVTNAEYEDYNLDVFTEEFNKLVEEKKIKQDYDGEDGKGDEADVRKWIFDSYEGLKEGEARYTGDMLKKYNYIGFLTRMGVEHTTGTAGERVKVSDVRPIRIGEGENAEFVLRFDVKTGTATNPKLSSVDIPFNELQVNSIIAELESSLKNTDELASKVEQLDKRRMHIMTKTDFIKKLSQGDQAFEFNKIFERYTLSELTPKSIENTLVDIYTKMTGDAAKNAKKMIEEWKKKLKK